LDKNLRKWGVLSGEEVSKIDLTRKPSMDIGKEMGISTESIKLDKEMNRAVRNILFFILNDDYMKVYNDIDCNKDGNLSVSEINLWFCRNRLKTNDQVMIRQWRNIVGLCMKIIDHDNNGSVSRDEFPSLYKFLRMYERF